MAVKCDCTCTTTMTMHAAGATITFHHMHVATASDGRRAAQHASMVNEEANRSTEQAGARARVGECRCTERTASVPQQRKPWRASSWRSASECDCSEGSSSHGARSARSSSWIVNSASSGSTRSLAERKSPTIGRPPIGDLHISNYSSL